MVSALATQDGIVVSGSQATSQRSPLDRHFRPVGHTKEIGDSQAFMISSQRSLTDINNR